MSANEETHLLQQSPGGQQTTESSGADQDEFRWGQDPNVDIMVTEDLEADLRKGFARKTFGLTGAMLVVWAIIMFSSKFRMCSALGAAAQDPNSILSLHESNKNGKESLSKQTADDHKKYIMGYQNLCVTGFVQMKENGAGGEMTPDIPDDERLLNVHVALFLVAIQHLFIAGIVAFVGVCFAIPILCTIFCCGPCCGVGAVRKAPLSYILCFGLAASYGMITPGGHPAFRRY
ncbi:unnamed protein product [Amoebophrya sp. A25]|nr:unnamed protein product [Amoebophrya sp. A25]|eukprot:GSA25T00010940001.1